MVTLVSKIKLFLDDQPQNIKQKRSIISSLKQKISNKFNVSIAEIEDNDKLHIATIGLAIIANDKKLLDSTINKIQNYIDNFKNIKILESQNFYYTDLD